MNTITQIKTLRGELKAKAVEAKHIRTTIANLVLTARTERAQVQIAKQQVQADKKSARVAKKADRIVALEAKLMALRTGPVGSKAIKASKKPGKVTITKA
jgi:hypothetical protein